MAELQRHGRTVESVFGLLGESEDDMTCALGWALSRSPSLLRALLHKLDINGIDTDSVVIRLQEHEKGGGVTDVEIECPGLFFLIIEAKRGWVLPGQDKLALYANRLHSARSRAPVKLLVALTQCSSEYAEVRLVREVAGVSVRSMSWRDVAALARQVRAGGAHAEKRLLDELLNYLKGQITMLRLDSNWAYVVSLGSGTPEGWTISWIDIVNRRCRYFHPVGRGWLKEPPNYIAFRYDGKLQSIHHIEDYEVFTNMHEKIPEIPDEEWGPFFLYTLGPAFRPDKEVRTGKGIYRNGRVWCMLDTLLTCNTISEALATTKARLQ